jgi:methylated-DNA-[protein]-cysteine S-methyltransferase
VTATVQTIDTPDGPFTIVADDDGAVLASGWTADPESVLGRIPRLLRPAAVRTGMTDAAASAVAYYDGDMAAIDSVAVSQDGTPWQRAGWRALRAIRPGDPLTYTEFATILGRPGAVRAAASVCARNAPALFVPCHRVLRADGTLGGFAWGVEVKNSLLRRETAGGLAR